MTLPRSHPLHGSGATLAPRFRALKLLVVGMGVLILVGLAIVGVALFQRSQGALDGAGQRGGFGTTSVTLPPGAAIIATAADGNRMILRARIAPDHEELIIIDLRNGQENGRIVLRWTASASR